MPVHVDLVMTDTTLLGHGRASATVHARGQVPVPIPGLIARTLVARAGAAGRAWLRRLYTTPDRTALVAMDSRSRRFPDGLAHLVRLSDQSCRTPWCDAPIAETDHVEDYADDGPTARENAQGLCRRCNLAKQAPGWSAQREPDGTVTTTTPTGHTYTSHPPPLLGTLDDQQAPNRSSSSTTRCSRGTAARPDSDRRVRRPARPRPTGRAASRRPGRASRRPTPREWRSRWRRAGR